MVPTCLIKTNMTPRLVSLLVRPFCTTQKEILQVSHQDQSNHIVLESAFHMTARVLELEDSLAISVCERFNEDWVIAPSCLRKGLFTVGAIYRQS